MMTSHYHRGTGTARTSSHGGGAGTCAGRRALRSVRPTPDPQAGATIYCGQMPSCSVVFVGIVRTLAALLLHRPLVSGCPQFRVGLVIPVPVVRGAWRKQVVLTLHQRYMSFAEEHVIALRVRRGHLRGILE